MAVIELTSRGDAPKTDIRFERAGNSLRIALPRSEVTVHEVESPMAHDPSTGVETITLAAAINGAEKYSDPLGTGRFLLMFDPEEPEEWSGPFRIVCFAQATMDADMGNDTQLAGVAWSWLLEALDESDVEYSNLAGTVTTNMSTGFAGLEKHGIGSHIELRASWSPVGEDLAPHCEAWGELLCNLAGLPPEGTESLEQARARHIG